MQLGRRDQQDNWGQCSDTCFKMSRQYKSWYQGKQKGCRVHVGMLQIWHTIRAVHTPHQQQQLLRCRPRQRSLMRCRAAQERRQLDLGWAGGPALEAGQESGA